MDGLDDQVTEGATHGSLRAFFRPLANPLGKLASVRHGL
jgi:hypothetical protein